MAYTMIMENKSEQARKFLSCGKEIEALRIVKSFRIMTKAQKSQIMRGFECTYNSGFYKQLGYDPAEEIEKAVKTAKEILCF